jgi:hypothetical protein
MIGVHEGSWFIGVIAILISEVNIIGTDPMNACTII